MNVLILCGGRNPKGQTARAVGAFVEGLGDAGAEHQLVFLPEKKIERCRQCDENGWGTCRTEGKCCQQDDFAGLVEQVRAADAVAFATPVYWGDLSESLKTFLDRLRRIACWHETGKQGIAGKPVMGICVAGGGGGAAPACCVQLEKVLQQSGMDVVDMVPARRQNLEMKLGVLKHVGRWFAAAPRSNPAAKASR